MYLLNDHVRACSDNGSIILLDLRADRYFSIQENQAPALLRPIVAPPGTDARALIAQNLLRAEPLAPLESTPARAPIQGELPLAQVGEAAVGLALYARFFGACLRARESLRRRRLDLTFKAIARLRARISASARGDIAAHVATYERLRPWYPKRRVCLFDSLSLSFFLLGLGHTPRLVLGVRAQPFSAHCWLEADGICLNDSAGLCRTYTPIASA